MQSAEVPIAAALPARSVSPLKEAADGWSPWHLRFTGQVFARDHVPHYCRVPSIKKRLLGSRIRKSALDQTIASNLSSFRNGQLSVMYCLSPYDYSSWVSEVPVCFQIIPQSLCLLCVCIYAKFGTCANARAILHKNANPGPLQT